MHEQNGIGIMIKFIIPNMNIFKLVYLLLNTMQNLEVNLYKEKLNMLKKRVNQY